MRLSSTLLLCVVGTALLLCLLHHTEAARVNHNSRLRHARVLGEYDEAAPDCCDTDAEPEENDGPNNSTSPNGRPPSEDGGDDGDGGDGADGGDADDDSQGKVTVVANNNALNLDEQAAQRDALARAKKLQKEAEKKQILELEAEETKQKEEDQKLQDRDEQEKKRHHQEEETKLQEQLKKRQEEQDKATKGKAQESRAMVPANCLLWGSSHYVTFKKVQYDLYSSGEFVLASDPDFNEQINVVLQKPHSDFPVTYATGVSFRSGNHQVAVQLLKPRSEFNARLYVDNKEFNFHKGQVLHAGDLQVNVEWKRDDEWKDKLLITVVSSASGTTVEVRANQHEKMNEHMVYLNIKVAAKGYSTSNVRTGGLCGRYEPNSENHLVMKSGEAVTDAVKMALSWIVPSTESLFAVQAKLDPISWNDIKNSKDLTPEQLAKGDKDLVDKAMKSCFGVPEPTRSNCVIDYLAGGGKATVDEALKMAKVEQRV